MNAFKSLLVLVAIVLALVSFAAVFPFILLGAVCMTCSQAVDGTDALPEWLDASIDALTEPVQDFAAWVYEL